MGYPNSQGLYDPANEHDACGVGMVAHIKGQRSHSIVLKLDSSVGKLDTLMGELNQIAKTVNSEEGSLKKLVADPELYNHLNRTAASMSIIMHNLEPAIRDIRVFADKVARHPEIIGVGGALKNSSGLK